MVLFHLHYHHATFVYLIRVSPPCRRQSFTIKVAFFKQRRPAACVLATEEGHVQNPNGSQSQERTCSERGWWKKAIAPWNHVISSCNMKSKAREEDCKEDEQPLMLTFKVVAGLLGAAFFLANTRGLDVKTLSLSVQAFCAYFVASRVRGLPVATPLHLGQFSAITSALDKPSFMSTPSLILGFVKDGAPRFSYLLDILLERHPVTYILLLTAVCLTLVCIGGLLFTKFRSFQQNRGDSFWDAWASVCSSSTHLKEKTALERGIGLMLAVGGLLFYSLLTSTMTAQFKSRMEWLREGAHSEVMEEGHVVICGTNHHLTTVLKQLNKSHQLALRNGSAKKQKQTVLLLSENERKITEKMVSDSLKDLLQLNVLTRSGSLSNTASFEKVGANKAQSIIVLASDGNKYEADAESVLTVLALQPLLKNSFEKLTVEVFNMSTAELLKSSMGLKVNTLQNVSSKILVQCSRQPGLINVYQELLEHDRQVLNVRSFPNLAGITYQQLRRGFSQAIVCGLVQEGKIVFHPPDHYLLKENDKVVMICANDGQKIAPQIVTKSSELEEKLSKDSVSIPSTQIVSKGAEWQEGPKERILILGWHPRVAEMITEYDDYVGPGTELIILSDTPKEEREYILSRKIRRPLQNVQINLQVGNPMSRTDVKAAILPSLAKPKSELKQNMVDDTNLPLSIVVIADSTWKAGDKSRPDKRSVLALLLAEDVCKKLAFEVNSLVAEFVDYKLGKQVMNLRPNLKAVGTDEIVGLVTAQVAEQNELAEVWTDLLNSWGDEIYIKDMNQYLKAGEAASFAELAEQAQLRKEIAIGYRKGEEMVINPPLKEVPLHFLGKDALVVISEYQYT